MSSMTRQEFWECVVEDIKSFESWQLHQTIVKYEHEVRYVLMRRVSVPRVNHWGPPSEKELFYRRVVALDERSDPRDALAVELYRVSKLFCVDSVLLSYASQS